MSGLVVAPAPWKLKGRAWSFLLSGISSFPAGFATPHQAEILASGGEFIGGQGSLMIISYSESPVGPYDELIYIPGTWKYGDGSLGYRITRIYVSSKASTENGRRNWNIPKEVADFSITSQGGVTTITVAHPGVASPFFQATIKPVPVISRIPIPFNSNWLSHFDCVQPPLPSGKTAEEVGTTQWSAVHLELKGKVHLVTITGANGKLGDNESFPVVVPWSLGGYIPEMDFGVGVPKLLDSVTTLVPQSHD